MLGIPTLRSDPSEEQPTDEVDTYEKINYHALAGNWGLLLEESDCVQSMVKALGVSLMRRIALKRHASQTNISVTEKPGEFPEWHFVTNLPLNTIKESKFTSDDQPFIQDDAVDTGVWSTTAFYSEGCLRQIRTNKKGTQIDSRCVFNEVPTSLVGKVRGPVMKFEWIFEPSNGEPAIKAVQWLEKIEEYESTTDTSRSSATGRSSSLTFTSEGQE